MTNKTIGLVLARSGSKGIKNKNIKKIKNKYLISYSLESILKSKICSKIIVSTDSNSYIKILENKFKNNIIFFKRSKKYASDKTSSEESINEVFKVNKKIIENFDNCIFFQLTSPLVQPKDFKNAYEYFIKKKFDSLFTGYKSKKFYWTKKNGSLKPINYKLKKRPRRQDFKGSIIENGAFYIFKLNKFLKFKNRLFGKIGFYEMPEIRSLEIDNKSDLKFFKCFLNKNV